MRLVAALLLVVAGAAQAGAALAPLRYLEARGRDLLEAVELNVGLGRGAKLSVKYGFQLFGLGDVRSQRFGTFGYGTGTWRELDFEAGFLPLSVLVWPVSYGAGLVGWHALASDARAAAQIGSEGVEYLDRKELNGDPAYFWKDTVEGPVHTRWGDCFAIGGEAHAGVGLRAMIRPLQLVDFVIGIVGLDLDPWLETNPRR